ncbi:helix-turn-helix domain-containing protein [Streptomyces krungchingensis]|uniref:helix-turn-helix domain-containing protein n=1 Tax=Streptomyces krungchingensis TaxID=1565034 RepID=UPI003CE8976D
MLKAVGISAHEADVYRTLVTTVTASAEEISATTGSEFAVVQRLLAALAEKGLARAVEGRPGRFAANPPEPALLPRLERRTSDLEKARLAVTDLTEAYRRHAWARGPVEMIETITGAEALRQRLRQLQEGARDELLWFCKAQYVAMPSGTNQAEFEALARGIRYQVLYEQAFFNDPDAVDNVVRAVRVGEEARAVPALPLRMAIADRTVAICPLAPAGSVADPDDVTALVIRGSSLLDALIALFERYWEAGTPLRVTSEGRIGEAGEAAPDSASPAPEDRHVLSLMIAGFTDESIATRLGVSKRTVQRRIQSLLNLAGVATRIQLGWHAARRDWL